MLLLILLLTLFMYFQLRVAPGLNLCEYSAQLGAIQYGDEKIMILAMLH